jgi:hypothetical protein
MKHARSLRFRDGGPALPLADKCLLCVLSAAERPAQSLALRSHTAHI